MKSTTFMQIAYLVSQESKCVSWKVGALIAKNGRIISTGYNGSPAGGINCCDHAKEQGWMKDAQPVEYLGRSVNVFKHHLASEHREAHSEWSSKNEIHAELNAILYAAKNGSSIDGATMYVTLSPCPDCAKAIANSGIKQLVYSETYDRNLPGWEKILKAAGVEVHQIPKANLNSVDWTQITNYGGEHV